MAIQVQDGKGRGHLTAVNSENHMMTRAVTERVMEHASQAGRGFLWVSTFATGGTDIEVISIENDEATELLHIEKITVSASVTGVWTFFEVTSGTPAGTSLTAQNIHLGSGATKSYTAFGNASVTGSLSGNNLYIWAALANTTMTIQPAGSVILATDDKVALTFSANGTVYVVVEGYWENPAR